MKQTLSNPIWFLTLTMVGAMLLPSNVHASSRTPGKVIAGWVEKTTILPWGVEVPSKLDTGALTSSIFAEEIERFRKDDERWVRFVLVLEDTDDEVQRIPVEVPLARSVRIKDHDDPSSRRAVVELELCFDGRKHVTEFSLADRSQFIYPVLLGRRFMEDVAIVDPSETFLTQAHCAD
mgnify:CR=1 FL=1